MSMKFLKSAASYWKKVSGNVVLKDTSADVGIGTDAPAALLDLRPANDATNTFRIHRGKDGGYPLPYLNIACDGNTANFTSGNTYSAANVAFKFLQADTGGTTTALTIGTTSDVTVSTGNLVIGTAGKGIDFSAQTATTETGAAATSELLDHYETGTWTGVIGSSSDNATMAAASTTGTYTRIGNLVTVTGYFLTTSLGSASGSLQLKGLPFASADNNRNYNSLSVGYGAGLNLTAGTSLGGNLQANDTYFFLYQWSATTGTTALTDTEWTADGGFMVSSSYMVS